MQLKKSLGQHFLKDKNILAKEARLLDVKGKTVLEIGPGDGRLTEQLLLEGAKKIIAVEKDSRLSALLEQKLRGKPVQVINGDFLELEPQKFKIDRIAGNIPYYISGPILFKLKEYEFETAVLMVQEEFARKMVAKPGSSTYSRLSVTSQLFYEIKYVQKVPARLFTPAPKVDSAIIILKKTHRQMSPKAEEIIRALFQHKNKTVRNALFDASFGKADVEKLSGFLKLRPRELGLALIVEICEKLER